MEFGKFHGHTLGQIAGFEPSYIDWVAGTVTRDPELVAAARVIQADLDARGISRRSHPTPGPSRPHRLTTLHAANAPQTQDRPPIPEGDRCGGAMAMIAAVPTSLRD